MKIVGAGALSFLSTTEFSVLAHSRYPINIWTGASVSNREMCGLRVRTLLPPTLCCLDVCLRVAHIKHQVCLEH